MLVCVWNCVDVITKLLSTPVFKISCFSPSYNCPYDILRESCRIIVFKYSYSSQFLWKITLEECRSRIIKIWAIILKRRLIYSFKLLACDLRFRSFIIHSVFWFQLFDGSIGFRMFVRETRAYQWFFLFIFIIIIP